jgi:conjugal transfer pilus assembly protein TraW
MKFSIVITVITLILLPVCCKAKDLGVIGPTYEIAERDLIEVILDRFRGMEDAGELEQLQDAYKRRVIEGIENPKPVAGIQPTQTARTYYIDPTWTLDRDVVDEAGRVMFPAETQVNPFDYDRLSKTLLFFDGGNNRQVEFARQFIAESKLPVKTILIAGEPLELMRKWKQEVFFDQGGVLIRYFSIKHSPAVVTQEGRRFRIDEIRL